MSHPTDSPRFDDDDDGPTIVCLDNVGTNPDTPPPSPMDWFNQNGGKPGLGPFGANGMGMMGMGMGPMGMGMGMNPMNMGMMPMMAPNGMPMDPMMAARTMFDAYIKGQQEARGPSPTPSNQYNQHTPRDNSEFQRERQYETLTNEMVTLKNRIANLQRAQATSEILSEPRLSPSPDMSQADMLQHHQMEIQRLRQLVANTSDEVLFGPDPLAQLEANGGGYGMMGGMVPPSVDNVYMQQAKQIETLMQQIEDLETRKTTKKGSDEDPFFANAGREYHKSHDSEGSLVGDGRSMVSVDSRMAGEARMADADDFIGDRLMEETSHLEWQPLAPCHYVRMNVKTVDRSNRVLPYEAKMIGRQGTLVIAVTMYNEEWDALDRTLRGVIRNLTSFREGYGPRMSTKITVIILADGRDKMHESTIEGLRRHGFIDSRLNQPCQPNSIHTFFTRVNLKQGTLDYGPLQVLVAIKESNGGKLHSHKVLLHGFCLRINPTYIFLLDCGTKPKPKALFLLYDYMERDPNIGGCAGEIEAEPNWCNPLVMSQVFEYKVAHIFDKAAESLLGFISVLPGAFSAYRYRALTESDGDTGRCPLDKYFDGLSGDYGPFRSNIYLAEDRILGFELIGRHGTSYTLKYIPGSVATTDVPQHVDDLLKQRKRWLNGALFALFYAFLHMKQFFTSGLSVFRKAMISFELLMLTTLTVFNLFGLGMYYLIFKFIVYDVLIDDPSEIGFSKNMGKIVGNVLNFSFVFVLLIQVVFGLGNSQPTHIKIFYTFATLFFAVFQLIILIMSVWFIAQTTTLNIVYLSVSIGLYFLGAIVHQPKDILLILASGPWYILLTPIYVIVLPMRAFANIHDISWGTKGLEDANVNSRKQGFQKFRSLFILLWLALNGGLVTLAVVLQGKVDDFSDTALRVSFAIACGINLFRFVALCLVRLEQLCCMGARRPHDDADDPDDDFGAAETFPGLGGVPVKDISPSYPHPGYPYIAGGTHMPSLPPIYASSLPMSYSPVSGMPNSFVPPTPVGGGVMSPSSIHILDRSMMVPSPLPDSERGRTRSASVVSGGSESAKKTRFAAAPSVIPISNTTDYMASVQQYLASMNVEKPQSGEP